MSLVSTTCCGVKEIEYLSGTSRESLLESAEDFFLDDRCAFIIFTDIQGSSKGRTLSRMIKKLKLGDVIVTRSKRNPNTNNLVTVWVWRVNQTAFKSWWLKNKSEDDSCDY